MLKTRVITAFFLTIGFLLALFFASKTVWTLLTLAVTMIGVWEWAKLIKLSKNQTLVTILSMLIIELLIIYFSTYSSETAWGGYVDQSVLIFLSISAVFWILIAPTWLILRFKISHRMVMAILGNLLLLATWIGLNGLHKISPLLLLSVLATVWLADSAAYFAGKKFGKHKLAIEISPGKTWEGVAGAMLAVTIYGLVLCHFIHYSRWLIVILWLIVVLSVMGDLFESLLKRQAGVKDSSHLLPGHGGVLDRIDGLIPTLPLALLYIYFPLFSSVQLHAS